MPPHLHVHSGRPDADDIAALTVVLTASTDAAAAGASSVARHRIWSHTETCAPMMTHRSLGSPKYTTGLATCGRSRGTGSCATAACPARRFERSSSATGSTTPRPPEARGSRPRQGAGTPSAAPVGRSARPGTRSAR
ncbi:acyl-CoA carboxylase epsilon subunit [Streptomyces sp. NPDC052811]|uniref:acyl-CoA carboxylase epsilon subunit n=1 Tax=Streptomyces sp. NPDC052811 TaxID=3155731 RepID=UPI003447A956